MFLQIRQGIFLIKFRFKMQVGLENFSNKIDLFKKDDFLIVMKYGIFNFT
jgi:hypothetical protein